MYQTESWTERLYHFKELSPLEIPVDGIYKQMDLLLTEAKIDWALYTFTKIKKELADLQKNEDEESFLDAKTMITLHLLDIYALFTQIITTKESIQQPDDFIQKVATRLNQLSQQNKDIIPEEAFEVLGYILVQLSQSKGKLYCQKKYEVIPQEKIALFVDEVLNALCWLFDEEAKEIKSLIHYQYVSNQRTWKDKPSWLHIEYMANGREQLFIHVRDVKLTNSSQIELLNEGLLEDTELIFENCVVDGKIYSPYLFSKKNIFVSYMNCQFNGPVLIENDANLIFFNCLFLNEVSFNNKELTDAKVFDKCVFEKQSAFKMINCKEKEIKDFCPIISTSQKLLQSIKRASHNTPSQAELVLIDCVFKGDVDFSGSILPNKSKLKHLSFFGKVNFTHTIFSKETILEDFAFPAIDNPQTKLARKSLEKALKQSGLENNVFDEAEKESKIKDSSEYEAQLKRGFLEVKWASHHIGIAKRTLDNLRTKDRKDGITDHSIPFTIKTGNVYYHLDVLNAYNECEKTGDWELLKELQKKYQVEWEKALNENKRGSK